MVYVEAPNIVPRTDRSLFLAGSITGSRQWQSDLCDKIKTLDIVVYNPRRANFPIHDPHAAYGQIKWEYERLRDAGAISFWFAKETIGPIVLFEIGAWSMTKKPILVGVEPGYQRAQDVEIQLGLVRPEVRIRKTLDDLANDVILHFRALKYL